MEELRPSDWFLERGYSWEEETKPLIPAMKEAFQLMGSFLKEMGSFWSGSALEERKEEKRAWLRSSIW